MDLREEPNITLLDQRITNYIIKLILIPTNICSSHLSSKKFLFVAEKKNIMIGNKSKCRHLSLRNKSTIPLVFLRLRKLHKKLKY